MPGSYKVDVRDGNDWSVWSRFRLNRLRSFSSVVWLGLSGILKAVGVEGH